MTNEDAKKFAFDSFVTAFEEGNEHGKLDRLLLYYPSIKPTPLKIKVYIDYLSQIINI